MAAETLHSLKPCPFCGSAGVMLVGSFVRCGHCGASGPFGCTAEDAVGRWNERHAIQDADSLQTLAPLAVAGPPSMKQA